MTRSGSAYYYMADGLGSIRNVVDSSQTVQNTYDYYAFGNTLGTPTTNVTNPFEYTAREFENGGVNGTRFYRNRFYMSGLGVFTSRDAMWADIGRGWGYVGNRPTAYSDPTGLYGPDVHREKTKEWGIGIGIDPDAASEIAEGDQAYDDNWETSPWNLFSPTGFPKHFLSPEKAGRDLCDALKNGDLDPAKPLQSLVLPDGYVPQPPKYRYDPYSFGQQLHKIQDSYSHYVAGYRTYTAGHVGGSLIFNPKYNLFARLDPPDPAIIPDDYDLWGRDDKDVDMANRSKALLDAFNNGTLECWCKDRGYW